MLRFTNVARYIMGQMVTVIVPSKRSSEPTEQQDYLSPKKSPRPFLPLYFAPLPIRSLINISIAPNPKARWNNGSVARVFHVLRFLPFVASYFIVRWRDSPHGPTYVYVHTTARIRQESNTRRVKMKIRKQRKSKWARQRSSGISLKSLIIITDYRAGLKPRLEDSNGHKCKVMTRIYNAGRCALRFRAV